MKTASIFFIIVLALVTDASAQSAAAKAAPAAAKAGNRYIFGVSEGTSGGIDMAVAIDKYRPLAAVMEKALGKSVVISFVRKFEVLEAGMKSGEFDLVLARPSDYPARGVRDYKYSMVASLKPDGQCVFIVEKSSPLKTVADVKGKSIMLPEKMSYMSKFCAAELRDKGIIVARENVTYAKEQGAVGWTVENKLADVGGVASYSGVAKNWEKGGQRILHKSVPQPYSPLIASARVPADRIEKLKAALTGLDKTDEGKKVLETLGIQGFNPETPERLLALLAWLEKSAL